MDHHDHFWGRLKRGIRPNSGGASTRIGQACSDRDILCRWREHFAAVVNSKPSQRRIEERMKVETMIRKQMGGPNLPWWCVDIKVAEVVKAVRHLN